MLVSFSLLIEAYCYGIIELFLLRLSASGLDFYCTIIYTFYVAFIMEQWG
jgi:hypothetical protein